MNEKIKGIYGSVDREKDVKRWLKLQGGEKVGTYRCTNERSIYCVHPETKQVKIYGEGSEYLFDIVQLPHYSLKVFESHARENQYGGGMILVSASSAGEALEIAWKESESAWLFGDFDIDKNDYVTKLDERMTPFTEVEGIEYSGTEAKVLLESIYFE